MSRIFWDTNIFVYLIEDYPVLSTHAFELRERMLERNDQLFTSTMTLGELLIKPLEVGDKDGVLKYQTLLTTGTVLIPFEQRAALTLRRDPPRPKHKAIRRHSTSLRLNGRHRSLYYQR